jgi:L-rhamnose-H+ transport protein
MFTTHSGLLTLAGILVALIGVSIVSFAGHKKEQQLGSTAQQFNLKKGLLLAGMCGVFSSGMSFAIDASKPIEASALHLGVPSLYAALPSYVIIMGGGALVNFSYCIVRLIMVSNLSFKADCSQPWKILVQNASLAAAGGTMWYLQFFFYAWGAANIAQHLSYVNWMLHMSGYVLCGGLVGLALGEWRKVDANPVRLLWLGMIVIILAANLVGLGMAS